MNIFVSSTDFDSNLILEWNPVCVCYEISDLETEIQIMSIYPEDEHYYRDFVEQFRWLRRNGQRLRAEHADLLLQEEN